MELHDFHAAKYGSAKPEEGSWFILKKTGIEAVIIPSSTRRLRMFNIAGLKSDRELTGRDDREI